MTKQEAIIISAFTGVSCCKFSDMHEYIEKIMGHPVWTHELANKEMWGKIKEKAKPDFMAIVENLSDDNTHATSQQTIADLVEILQEYRNEHIRIIKEQNRWPHGTASQEDRMLLCAKKAIEKGNAALANVTAQEGEK